MASSSKYFEESLEQYLNDDLRMAKAPFFPTADPYHISCRCINKDWFSCPLDEVWELACDLLFLTKKMYNLRLHSFVLMNNHFHILLTAPDLNISQAMQYFIRETSRNILKDTKRINHTFKSGFSRTRITSYHHFTTAYKYDYRNPVEVGLVKYCEEYRYSTLSGLLGLSRLTLPLEEDALLFDGDIERTLKWLNAQPERELVDDVRKALRRNEFQLPRQHGQVHMLEQLRF